MGGIKVGNRELNGSGTINTIFTANSAAKGALIKSITIKAQQSTHEGAVRLFISPGGTPAWKLLHEVWIPQTTQSAFDPSFKCVIPANLNLQAGYLIGASTEFDESYSITVEGEDWGYPIS